MKGACQIKKTYIIINYHSFMEVFKIIKFQSPISLFQLFNLSNRNYKYTLNQPKVKFDIKLCKIFFTVPTSAI